MMLRVLVSFCSVGMLFGCNGPEAVPQPLDGHDSTFFIGSDSLTFIKQ